MLNGYAEQAVAQGWVSTELPEWTYVQGGVIWMPDHYGGRDPWPGAELNLSRTRSLHALGELLGETPPRSDENGWALDCGPDDGWRAEELPDGPSSCSRLVKSTMPKCWPR